MKILTGRIAGGVAALALLAAIGLVVAPAAARTNIGAPVRQSATGHTITVQGHGEVTAAPDEATVTVGVDTRGTDAQSALSKNADKMTSVIAAIKSQGVDDSHIQTTDLNLYYDSQQATYSASHQVTVTLDDVNKVGPVLDAAVGAGANNSWGVSFGLKDQSTTKAQALKNAVGDARAHANSLASALGVTVSGVGSASEVSYNYQPVVYDSAARAAAPVPSSAPTPIQAGELTVTADVAVVYTFG